MHWSLACPSMAKAYRGSDDDVTMIIPDDFQAQVQILIYDLLTSCSDFLSLPLFSINKQIHLQPSSYNTKDSTMSSQSNVGNSQAYEKDDQVTAPKPSPLHSDLIRERANTAKPKSTKRSARLVSTKARRTLTKRKTQVRLPTTYTTIERVSTNYLL